GTIVAGRAGGSVATTHGGDVLERTQVTKGASVATPSSAGTASPTMFSALAIRPGRTATNSAAARPIQFGRKDFENSIAMHPIDCFQQRPPNGWLGCLMVLLKSISAGSNVLHSLDRSLPRRRRILAQLIARARCINRISRTNPERFRDWPEAQHTSYCRQK